jgi:hypothetical protein
MERTSSVSLEEICKGSEKLSFKLINMSVTFSSRNDSSYGNLGVSSPLSGESERYSYSTTLMNEILKKSVMF